MQKIFLKHGIPLPRRYRAPMTYQTRLALAFAAGFTAFAIFCFAAFLLTATRQKPVPQFPDIIATQPKLQP